MFPQNTTGAAAALLAGLNDEQRAAVMLPPEHALILAGAGSGKTRVLTTRIAWLLQTQQVTPGGVLAVTFTNKAAKEMQARLSAMLPLNVRGMWIGTFHGLCHRFLRAHHQLAGLPQAFQILDVQDQLSAIKRLCKQFGVDEERFPPKQLQWFISGCKEDGLRPHAVQADDAESRKKVELYQLYEEQCQREGVVDFGELMLRSYELLQGNDPLRAHYRRRFRHILIDEFQDTNRLQYAWIKCIVGLPGEQVGPDGPGGAIMAVGDDDQSIYAFRGARVGNMHDFVLEFQVRHQIKLEQNYRSHSHILDCANTLISHNQRRLGKNLRTTLGAGEPVRVHEAPTDLAEAEWLVDEVRQLVRENGLPRQQIAVLYRSNAQSRAIESQLFNAGVPYRVYGGLRFFERAEIKHALAYLRLLENPRDDTSFLRVVNFPPRGIGARTVEQLQDAARASGAALHDAASAVPGRAGAHLRAFIALLDVLREQTQGQSLRQIVELVAEGSGLIDHYRAEKEGQDRIENLHELASAAESFVTQEGFGRDAVALPLDEHGAPLIQSPVSQGLDPDQAGARAALAPDADTGETLSPLAAFLTHAALEAGDNQAQAGQDAVQLMTVHAAKGLEFDAVFITGLEEGLFPHDNALADFDGLEEERRLMYVAITRARQRLYLSHAQVRMLHGQTRYNLRSRFLDELPEAALKWLTPKSGSSGSGFGSGPGERPGRHTGGPSWAFHSGTGRDLGRQASAAALAPPRTADTHGIRLGMQVFHNKFGEGAVLALEGSGSDARAQVKFNRHGVKWLALSVAKLTPVP
ncbi:DNA helicase II [Comamonadaceae bacterium OH2545_COT-014]|nr:DNA helicase II [Comamonadaceae bacterium OH2545_COT-014]